MSFNKHNMKYFQYYNEPSLANQRPVITQELSSNDTNVVRKNNNERIKYEMERYNEYSSDESSSEEYGLKWIVENCPPTNVVRDYLKTQLECIQDTNEFDLIK